VKRVILLNSCLYYCIIACIVLFALILLCMLYYIYCVAIVVILPFECVVAGRPFGRILVQMMVVSLYSTLSQTSEGSFTFGNRKR